MRTIFLLLVNFLLLGIALVSGFFLLMIALVVMSATVLYLLIRSKLSGRQVDRTMYSTTAIYETTPLDDGTIIDAQYQEISSGQKQPPDA